MNATVLTPSDQQVLCREHQSPGQPPQFEVISPARSAALVVGKYRKLFKEDYDLNFPSCLEKHLDSPPIECYRILGLGDCEKRRAFIERGRHYELSNSEGKIKWASERDVVVYTNRPPSCFVPYQVPQASSDSEVIDVDIPKPATRLSREEIWALLTKEERLEILTLHHEVGQFKIVEKLTAVLDSNWFVSCMRSLTAGIAAIKQNLRLNKKRASVDACLQTARENILSPALKRKRMVEQLLEGVTVRNLFQDLE